MALDNWKTWVVVGIIVLAVLWFLNRQNEVSKRVKTFVES